MNRLAVGFCGTAFLTAWMPYGPAPSLCSLMLGMGLLIWDGAR